jgi:hypothetical protein
LLVAIHIRNERLGHVVSRRELGAFQHVARAIKTQYGALVARDEQLALGSFAWREHGRRSKIPGVNPDAPLLVSFDGVDGAYRECILREYDGRILSGELNDKRSA